MLRPFFFLIVIGAIILPVDAQAPSFTETSDTIYNDYTLSLLTKAQQPVEIRYLMTDSGKLGVKAEKGLLFTFAGRGVKQGAVAGDFSSWRTVPMKKGKNGVWFYVLTGIEKDEPFRYKFCLDGIWTEDPANPERDADDSGSYISKARPAINENHQLTFKILKDGDVDFRIFNPKARYVAIAGDFNNWNPENDILVRNNKNEWHLVKHLPKGSYRYSYIVDGNWTSDIYNSTSSRDVSGKLCSLIVIK